MAGHLYRKYISVVHSGLWVLIFSSILHLPLNAQKNTTPKSKKANLIDLFKELESTSNLIFNYDPDLVGQYYASTHLPEKSLPEKIDFILSDTPFEFKLLEENILIYLPEKKEIQLCGRVLNVLDKSPLPFANVLVEGQQKGTQSDVDGRFELSLEAYKNQSFQVSYVGFETKLLKLRDWPEDDCLMISLEIDQNLYGEEIIVRDYLAKGIEEGDAYSSINLNYDFLTKNYSNQEHDILKTVQLIPGITSTDESATNLVIRGATPDHNLILWEDVTLYDPGHIFGMISSINPFIVDNVQVFKGVFDSSYDNRIGGVVDISLPDSVVTNTNIGAGISMTAGNFFIEQPIIKNKLSLLVSGRKTIFDFFRSPTLNRYTQKVFQTSRIEENKMDEEEGYLTTEETLDFYDWNIKILAQPIEKLRLKTSIFKSDNFYNYFSFFDDDFSAVDYLSTENWASSSSADYQWNDFHNSDVKLSFSRYTNDYEFELLEDEALFFHSSNSNSITDFRFGIAHQYQNLKGLKFSVGYQYDSKEVSFSLLERNRNELEYFETEVDRGIFHNIYHSVSFQKDNLAVDWGLRVVNHAQTSSWLLSPRLNFQVKINPSLKFKFSGGILHQFISKLFAFNENGLTGSNNLWILNTFDGGPFLESRKVSFGVIFNQNGWLVDVDGYFNKTDGILGLTTSLQNSFEIDGTGSGRTRGVDILLQKRIKQYQFNLNYALSKNEYFFLAVEDDYFPAPNNQLHRLSIVNQLKIKHWQFSTTYQFKSGLPFNQPNGLIIEGYDDEDEMNYYTLDYNSINGQSLRDYHRLDVGVTYKRKLFNEKVNTEISFSILNLFNRDNLFSRDYFLNDESAPELDVLFFQRSLLRRTPLFMCRVEF